MPCFLAPTALFRAKSEAATSAIFEVFRKSRYGFNIGSSYYEADVEASRPRKRSVMVGTVFDQYLTFSRFQQPVRGQQRSH